MAAPTITLTDLDERPDLAEDALALLRGCPPGREHAVIGLPERMGLPPGPSDLANCLGVLIAVAGKRVVGVLGICPYSDQQITLWGPVVHRGHTRRGIGALLLREGRRALRDGGFESLRVLVDQRNRNARAFFLNKGLTAWKDNEIFQRRLDQDLSANPGGVSLARPGDHDEVAGLLAHGFPDSGHLDAPLAQREREGYRHYILQDSGTIVAVAAVKDSPRRHWMSLIAVDATCRGQGLGRRLLAGTLHLEHERGCPALGLEVLADNSAAIALYRNCGFELQWRAAIMTGPL
jgi:ribosomal protein S18 acetylase RimI-like enzyme